MFDWKIWGIGAAPHSNAPTAVAGQAVQSQQTAAQNPMVGQFCNTLATLSEQQAQALYLLHECVLMEEHRKRQMTAHVWVNLSDWQQLCVDRLQWSLADCTDQLLALRTAKLIQQHPSGRAIRPIGL